MMLAAESAAAVHRLPCPRPDGSWARTTHALVLKRGRRPPAGARRLSLPANGHYDNRLGLPVTTLLRTAIDIARLRPLPEALIVGDAVARQLVGERAGRQAYLAAANRTSVRDRMAGEAEDAAGLLSVEAARRISGLVDPAAESAPESLARGYIIEAGLARPEVGSRVVGASGSVYFADMLWPDHRLILEIDGRVKYTDPKALFREKVREDDLREAGFLVIRWTASALITNPGWLIHRLADVLPRRA